MGSFSFSAGDAFYFGSRHRRLYFAYRLFHFIGRCSGVSEFCRVTDPLVMGLLEVGRERAALVNQREPMAALVIEIKQRPDVDRVLPKGFFHSDIPVPRKTEI